MVAKEIAIKKATAVEWEIKIETEVSEKPQAIEKLKTLLKQIDPGLAKTVEKFLELLIWLRRRRTVKI